MKRFIVVGVMAICVVLAFFCFPHGLGFTEQNAFFAHLQDLHGISPGHAPAHLIQTGERFIFLDF